MNLNIIIYIMKRNLTTTSVETIRYVVLDTLLILEAIFDGTFCILFIYLFL